MTTVFDVPADLLIKKVAEEFKNNDKINSPAWSNILPACEAALPCGKNRCSQRKKT